MILLGEKKSVIGGTYVCFLNKNIKMYVCQILVREK